MNDENVTRRQMKKTCVTVILSYNEDTRKTKEVGQEEGNEKKDRITATRN